MFRAQALESEIMSREQVVTSLGSRSQQMVRSGHFASSRIEAAYNDLLEKLANIKLMVKERKLKLLDAVESQMVNFVCDKWFYFSYFCY